MTKFVSKVKSFFLKSEVLEAKDYQIIGILVLVFMLLVFYRLGNTYAPSSSYVTTEKQKDIVLDFGDYITIEKLYVYSGNLDNRKVAISAFNEVSRQWEMMRPEENISSVFQWNRIDVYVFGRYFGIVSKDDEAVFNEFVFVDNEGKVVLPVNADEYPELFDEQDMFFDGAEQTYMDGTMFDEIYYARTGYEFIHHLPTYETTHPQLGKCIISLGMLIFGTNPFGWRFCSALFGILLIPLMYAFAKALFKDTFIASCVGILITFDCMHFTLSRICTIDLFVAFFIILMYYFMYRYIQKDNEYRQNGNWINDSFPPKRVYILLMLSGIAMGCAIATKLTGVYAAVGLAVIFLVHTAINWPKKQTMKLFWFCVLFFMAIPIVQYILPYIPAVEKYAQMGITDKSITFDENGINIGYGWTGLLARTVRNTNYMINYHKNLQAEHPYMSPAYSWPIIKRPLLAANNLYEFYSANDRIVYIRSAVSYMGNPAIWWTSLPCILFLFIKAIFKRDKNAMFLSVGYIAQYLPWFLVSRCIFIYHYFPSSLFGILIIGYTIKEIIDFRPRFKKIIFVYLILVVLFFAAFFPVISGVPFDTIWGDKLKWFSTWALC